MLESIIVNHLPILFFLHFQITSHTPSTIRDQNSSPCESRISQRVGELVSFASGMSSGLSRPYGRAGFELQISRDDDVIENIIF